MATYPIATAVGWPRATAAFPAYAEHRLAYAEVDLDFAAITAARLAAGATALTSGDVLELIPVPAGAKVLHAGIKVTKAEGGTLTLDLGDGADPDGYLDGVDGNAVASYTNALALVEGTPNTILGYSGGKFYSAADTIDLTIVDAADTAVMKVWALMLDCS